MMARTMQARHGQVARLRHRIAFDRAERGAEQQYGGFETNWVEMRSCRAELIYMKGSEAVDAARLQGRSVFKVKVRNQGAIRDIASDHRMRMVNRGFPNGTGPSDPLPGTRFNVREVDTLSDKKWAFIIVESELS